MKMYAYLIIIILIFIAISTNLKKNQIQQKTLYYLI